MAVSLRLVEQEYRLNATEKVPRDAPAVTRIASKLAPTKAVRGPV